MTDTDLANQALGAIGAKATITSINENSPEAKACLREFASARDELLRKAHWDFARKAINGVVLKSAPGTPGNNNPATAIWNPTTQPPLPWLYEYQYPADCIQVRRIISQLNYNQGGPSIPIFSVSNSAYPPENEIQIIKFIKAFDTSVAAPVILTNQYQAIIEYTFKQTNSDLWDPSFQEAFVIALATRIVFPLTGKVSITKEMMERMLYLINEARVNDGNEGLTIWNTAPDWLQARYTGGFDGEREW